MKSFDLQGIDLNVPSRKALAFIADAAQLPAWTNAFESVSAGRAVMRTPTGVVTVDLAVHTSPSHGTIDWRITFPDQSVATAFSRVVELGPDRCAYSFVLTPPPIPLEQLEGALEAQSQSLAQELRKLKQILENDV
ncbi:MAG: SRPBCC family protein [Gemmatimonadota bacterium]